MRKKVYRVIYKCIILFHILVFWEVPAVNFSIGLFQLYFKEFGQCIFGYSLYFQPEEHVTPTTKKCINFSKNSLFRLNKFWFIVVNLDSFQFLYFHRFEEGGVVRIGVIFFIFSRMSIQNFTFLIPLILLSINQEFFLPSTSSIAYCKFPIFGSSISITQKKIFGVQK